MAFDLTDIGLTKEQIRDLVVEKLCEDFTEGDRENALEGIWDRVKEHTEERLTKLVAEAFETHVMPRVAAMVETITLTPTNKWGEKTQPPQTFREYLVSRAEAWINEAVNFEGKAKGQDSYSWTGTQTRIAHMIHQHLHYEISNAVKGALAEANKTLAKGIYETCRLKINEAVASVKITTEIPR